MISHGFKRLFSLLLFAFGFWSVQVSTAQEINHKLVPNLQQMKDSSPTPVFTLLERCSLMDGNSRENRHSYSGFTTGSSRPMRLGSSESTIPIAL